MSFRINPSEMFNLCHYIVTALELHIFNEIKTPYEYSIFPD